LRMRRWLPTIGRKYLRFMISRAIQASKANRVDLTEIPRRKFFCERHICCSAMAVERLLIKLKCSRRPAVRDQILLVRSMNSSGVKGVAGYLLHCG
jgi:hypothetical protein